MDPTGAVDYTNAVRLLARVAAFVLLLWPAWSGAVQVGALETRWDWELSALRFVGAQAVPVATLREAMLTDTRPWYAPWRALPAFDPVAFESDMERLIQLYRSRGHYRTRLGYDLELPAEGNALVAVVYIDEDAPTWVSTVDIEAPPHVDLAALYDLLPIDPNERFDEADYRNGEAVLRSYFRERGYARVQVTRSADVDVDANLAAVRYTIVPGPRCVFGPVTIRGTRRVRDAVLRRELPFAPGTPFQESLLTKTRTRLTALNLFQTIRFEEQGDDATVPIRISVSEAPPRDVRVGIGYDSEEQVRGLASWRHYDFLGSARQLGVTARASFLRYTLLTDFLQPHFPTATSRLRVLALAQHDDEDGYIVDRARGQVRAEWDPTPEVTSYVAYRVEYDSLGSVPAGLVKALPEGLPKNALQSGLGGGVEWARVDDLVDPHRGLVLKASLESIGGIFGADLSYVRATAEAHGWIPLPADCVLSLRARAGSIDPYGNTREVPLYERFFAGGTGSVRGFDRRRVGPLSFDDHPVGGRSLAEASVEFRHDVTDTVTGLAFVDGGQLDAQSWRVPFDRLQYGAGVGVRYRSPIGPLQVDLGFPFERPPHDRPWQLHVSVGAGF